MEEPSEKVAAAAVIAEADRTLAATAELVEAVKREKRRAKRLRREANRLERSFAGSKPRI